MKVRRNIKYGGSARNPIEFSNSMLEGSPIKNIIVERGFIQGDEKVNFKRQMAGCSSKYDFIFEG